MSLLLNVLVGVAVAVMGALGVRSCTDGLREQGREQVRAEWITADNARIAAERAAVIERQRTEREKELRMAREAEEKAREQAERDEALRARAAAAERAVAGLQRALSQANARSAQRRAAGTCPAADAEADAAAQARALLERCAGRYRAVGARAAELASQVIGLQDHVVVVQPEAAALLQAAPEDNDKETP